MISEPDYHNEPPEKPLWGPFTDAEISIEERRRQLRTVATLVYVTRVPGAMDVMPLVYALRRAECADGMQLGERRREALDRARRMFDLLPALQQRRIIATFNSVTFLRDGDNKRGE